MKVTQCLVACLLAVCATEVNAQGNNAAVASIGGLTRYFFDTDNGVRRGPPSRAAGKLDAGKRQGRRTKLKTLLLKDGCPEGFVRFRDYCFSQSLFPASWESARVACKGTCPGGDLASINSKEELDFIHKNFGGGKKELTWIGLHKEIPGTPYKWVNGDKVQYLPWDSMYTGQEPTGYAALSLTNLHFLPKTSRNEFLPFLCGTKSVLGADRGEALVHLNQPVKGEVNGGTKSETEGIKETGHAPAEIVNTCKEGWEGFEGKCYKAFNEKTSYKNAVATCKKVGANVMSLHGPGESKFVRKQVMTKNRPGQSYWLGLSNNQNGLWWSDGSPLDYTNFRPGMWMIHPPKKLISETEKKDHLEKCFQIGSYDDIWENYDCDRLCFIVCIQKEDFQPPFNTPGTTTERNTKPTSTPVPRNYVYDGEIIDEELFMELMKGVVYAGALVPALNASGITTNLNGSDIYRSVQKSASSDSESKGGDDETPVYILFVVVGCVGLVLAAVGVISWGRGYRNLPTPWTSVQNSSTSESHSRESVRRLILDSETTVMNEQGIYGAME